MADDEQKSIFQSKTFWVGLAVVILGALQQYFTDVGVDDPLLLQVIGVVMVVLRWFSVGPVGMRDKR